MSALRWALFAALFIAMPMPYYGFVIGGLMPLSVLLVEFLATGFILDLLHVLLLGPLLFFVAGAIAKRACRLPGSSRMAVSLLLFAGLTVIALSPTYGVSHGSEGRNKNLVSLMAQVPVSRLFNHVGAALGLVERRVEPGEERVTVDLRGPSRARTGQAFEVDLDLSSNVPLGKVTSILMFDPQTLQCLSVSEGPLLASSGPAMPTNGLALIDDQCGATVGGRGAPSGTAGKGSGTAIRFMFKAVGAAGSHAPLRVGNLQVFGREPIPVSVPSQPDILIEP